jgi:hypothetical protein
MKTKLLMIFLLGFAGIVIGQEQKTFKERNRVIMKCDSSFFSSKKITEDSIVRKNVLYNIKNEVISFERDTIKKKPVKRMLLDIDSSEIGLKCTETISANLKIVNKNIMIYPWRFKYNKKVNAFFDKNDVYIKMEDRVNYSFRYRSWQLGVITLPIKWYVNSKLGNVETSLNAMINGGYKFGKSRFVKFPHEEKVREYKTGFSINGLAGISKIELNKSNTSSSQNGIAEGNVAAISIGSSLGFHYSDFTLMLATGFDLPTSNRKNWNFNGTPWIGLGFGYNFLKFN